MVRQEPGASPGNGDFEPMIDEATFYRVQAVLDGRVVVLDHDLGIIRISRSGDSCAARRAAVL
jgi:hypothetical protein